MVNNGEDAVISSTLWEPCDQVHGYLGERQGIVQDGDLVQGYAGLMCEVLVLLTCHTPFDVLLNPCLSSWPVEPVEDFPCCFITAWVSYQPIVVCIHDLSLKGLIWQDDYFPISV